VRHTFLRGVAKTLSRFLCEPLLSIGAAQAEVNEEKQHEEHKISTNINDYGYANPFAWLAYFAAKTRTLMRAA
jgi:hypothetical protein